ncbi:MAG: hypothetical protein COV76_04170, partial [Candidatus Omnitrophica bacterium CG11_big_fil_rev_8_21_14_0_20_64_10]
RSVPETAWTKTEKFFDSESVGRLLNLMEFSGASARPADAGSYVTHYLGASVVVDPAPVETRKEPSNVCVVE